MKRAAAIALLALSCATSRPVEPGVFGDRVYENAALDLRVVLPPGWVFLSREEIARSVEQRSASAQEKRAAKSALTDPTMLFTMADASHTPAASQPRTSVAAHAQRVAKPPAGLSSEQLAIELEHALLAGDAPIEIGTRRQALVGGRRFTVLPTVTQHRGVRGHLDHYLRYEDGRLLTLTMAYPLDRAAPPQEAVEAIRPLAPNTPEGTP